MPANYAHVNDNSVNEIFEEQSRRHYQSAVYCLAVGCVVGMGTVIVAMAAIYAARNHHVLLAVVSIVSAIAVIVSLLMSVRRSVRTVAALQGSHAVEFANIAHLALAGEISASIIHEVTQPLSTMGVNLDAMEPLFIAGSRDAAAAREIIDDMKRDRDRANEIIQRLRNLLSKRELQIEHIDVNEMVANMLQLLRADIVKRNVVVHTNLAPELSPVAADNVQLQQLFLNLFVNAIQAMADSPLDSRRLEVKTSYFDADNAEVIVSDSGPGMTQQQLEHAFESFFTTKKTGMGIGLSIARTIVLAHHGSIWIERELTGGTSFHFTIPFDHSADEEWNDARVPVVEAAYRANLH